MLLIAMAVTIGASRLLHDRLIDTEQARFDLRARHVTADVRNVFADCEQVLRGASGLFAVAPSAGAVTPDAWLRYVTQLDLAGMLPAVRELDYAAGSGIAEPVEGAPRTGEFASGTQPFAPITLAWPTRANTAQQARFVGDSANARAALLRTADTGQIAINIAPSLQSPMSGDESAHIELYLSVSSGGPALPAVPARRAPVVGFVVAVLDTGRLFGSIAVREPDISLGDVAGTPGTLLYASDQRTAKAADDAPIFRNAETLRFGGETVTLLYTTDDSSLAAIAHDSSNAVLITGTIASLLLATIAFLLMRESVAASDEASRAHFQSTLDEARMMGIIRSSMEAIISIDEAQRIVLFNPMAERVFGCSANDAMGTPLSRFIPERFRAAHEKHVERFGVTGVSERPIGKQRLLFGLRANGEEFPLEASISQIRDASGKLYTVVLRDVTERIKADDALRASREELRELSANLQNVREEEKTRIARELHDDLGQQLTALKMDLSSVEQALDAHQPVSSEARTRLRGMRRLIDATVASVRRIAADLRPVMLDDLGLVPAIEWLANDFTNRYGIEVDRLIEPGGITFTRHAATTLFRIVQEALTNVVRHAEATRVTLVLRIEGTHCVLQVADNGRGSTAGDTRTEKRFGLLGIRERAHMLGASVTIESPAGRGFTITVVFPLQAVQQEEVLP
jgi:PAS domain S-box-containing protein